MSCAWLGPGFDRISWPALTGGPQTRFDGRDAVVHWVQNAPKGAFIFERLSDNEAPPSDELPPGELTIEAENRVTTSTGDFTNKGNWTLVVSDGAIAGVLHVPQPL